MEEARVLILELGLVSGLASTLREMLETGAGRPIQALHEFIDISEGAVPVSALGKITGEFGPSVIFVLLSSATLKQASTVIECLNRNPCKVPIIAVI